MKRLALIFCLTVSMVYGGGGPFLPDDTSVVAHYIFNEWSGAATLNTAPNNMAGATLVNGPIHIKGVRGPALNFDNVAEPGVNIPKTLLPSGTQERTYAIISRMYNSPSHADTILAYGGSGAGPGCEDNFRIQTGLNEVLVVTYAGVNIATTYGNSTITDGEWVFLVVTYGGGDPGIERVYRNGVEVGSTTLSGTCIGTSDSPAIGYLPAGSGNYCSCDIKEVLISTRAWGSGEVKRKYFNYWGNRAEDN